MVLESERSRQRHIDIRENEKYMVFNIKMRMKDNGLQGEKYMVIETFEDRLFQQTIKTLYLHRKKTFHFQFFDTI